MVESAQTHQDISYDVSFEMKKNFSPSELTELQHAFKCYDTDKNGSMNAQEFKKVLIDLGKRDVTDEQVKEMLAQVDRNNDNQIQWDEFLTVSYQLPQSTDVLPIEDDQSRSFQAGVNNKGWVYLSSNICSEVSQTTSQHGGTHSYLVEERICFAKLINDILKNDEDVRGVIPLNPENDDVFHALEDGIILSKLVNSASENTIDFRAVNSKKNLNVYQVKENLNLALNACKGIGLRIPGINPQAFIEKKPHLILAVIWQVMRLYLTKSIDLKHCPEIMRLAEEGEDLAQLLKLPPEQILIRWINYHLKKQNIDRRVANLGGDLKDSKALLYVLNSLDSAKCSLSALEEEDANKRAEKMIHYAESLGVPPLVRPSDITSGNVKINTIFVSELFNAKHGLEELNQQEEAALVEKMGIVDDDIEGSRDERAFRFWINSLNIDDLYINNLYDECRDGLVLLKVINKLDGTIVDWKKVEKNPNNKFKQGINCGEALNACKKLGLKLPGIGGSDILDGNKKLVIAVVWQLVRLNYLKIIGSQSEDDLVKWANGLIGDLQIKNLKDSSLSNGQYLLKLCSSIEPDAIDWDIVRPGDTEEEKENNAKYIISIARKLGAVIFCVWEDIGNVNSKMLLVLVCSLFEIYQERKNR